VNTEPLLLGDTWIVRYVPTLPHDRPDLYDPARPELALPHTPELQWRSDGETQWAEWTLPPGVDHVTLPLADDVGDVSFSIEGKDWPIGAGGVVELDAEPSPARRATQRVGRRRLGGSILTGPVVYRFEEGFLKAGSWLDQGLRSYVGAVRMRQTIRLDWLPPSGAILDLGRVLGTLEARINGHELGERLLPPFQFGIGDHLRVGDNALELLLTRLDATLDCGVFGPVTIGFPGSS
jgi:hypothetical protein